MVEEKDIKKVVVYTRVSTTEQAEEGYSLENQERECRAYCEIRGYEVVGVYSDRGISAKDIKNRPGLIEALRTIRNKEVQGIVVWKMSRLSRNAADTANIIEMVKKHNGAIIGVKDSISTVGGFSTAMVTISGVFAEMERESIITQVKGGMREKARKGEWNGGMVPLGYELVDKKLVIQPQQAELIVRIFNSYLKGAGYKTIAKELNEEGYKTKKGMLFSGNSIKLILTNITYAGKIRWGKLNNWSYEDENGSRKRQYSDNVIEADGIHEAIIPMKVYNKVQEMIATNPRHHVKQFKGDHIISGLLRCPECGYGMSVQPKRVKGKVYWYYECGQYINKKAGCKPNLVPKEQIEEQFYDVFERIVNDPKFSGKILDGLSNTSYQIKNKRQIEKNTQQEINGLKKKQGKLIDELLEGDELYKQAIRSKIQEVNVQISEKQEKLQKIVRQIEELEKETINLEEVSEILRSVGKVLKLMPKDTQRKIVTKLISKIEVEEKSIKAIHFNFSDSFSISEDTVNLTTNKCAPFLGLMSVRNKSG